jgi:hypothetical protein
LNRPPYQPLLLGAGWVGGWLVSISTGCSESCTRVAPADFPFGNTTLRIVPVCFLMAVGWIKAEDLTSTSAASLQQLLLGVSQLVTHGLASTDRHLWTSISWSGLRVQCSPYVGLQATTGGLWCSRLVYLVSRETQWCLVGHKAIFTLFFNGYFFVWRAGFFPGPSP